MDSDLEKQKMSFGLYGSGRSCCWRSSELLAGEIAYIPRRVPNPGIGRATWHELCSSSHCNKLCGPTHACVLFVSAQWLQEKEFLPSSESTDRRKKEGEDDDELEHREAEERGRRRQRSGPGREREKTTRNNRFGAHTGGCGNKRTLYRGGNKRTLGAFPWRKMTRAALP